MDKYQRENWHGKISHIKNFLIIISNTLTMLKILHILVIFTMVSLLLGQKKKVHFAALVICR